MLDDGYPPVAARTLLTIHHHLITTGGGGTTGEDITVDLLQSGRDLGSGVLQARRVTLQNAGGGTLAPRPIVWLTLRLREHVPRENGGERDQDQQAEAFQ